MDISIFDQVEKIKLAAFFDEFEKQARGANPLVQPINEWTGQGAGRWGGMLGAALPLLTGFSPWLSIPAAFLGNRLGASAHRQVMNDRTRLDPAHDPEVLMRSSLFGTLGAKEQDKIKELAALKGTSENLKDLGASYNQIRESGVDPNSITSGLSDTVSDIMKKRQEVNTEKGFSFDKLTGKKAKEWAMENPGTAAAGTVGAGLALAKASDLLSGSSREKEDKKGNKVVVV